MTEAELCEYLAANHFSDCKKVDETYSTWDVTFTYDTKISEVAYYAELKCRKAHYDSLLIEEDKYKRLISAAVANGRRAAYICSTPEGIWGFDLEKVGQPFWKDELMPATTEFENTEKVIKSVGYLPVAHGRRLK
jgi:hypothetical protein